MTRALVAIAVTLVVVALLRRRPSEPQTGYSEPEDGWPAWESGVR